MTVIAVMVALASQKPIQFSRADQYWLVGKRRHDIRFRFAHQLVHGDKLKSAGTRAVDNQRERQHRSFPVAAAIVHKNNVAALLIVRLAGRQMVEHAQRRFVAA